MTLKDVPATLALLGQNLSADERFYSDGRILIDLDHVDPTVRSKLWVRNRTGRGFNSNRAAHSITLDKIMRIWNTPTPIRLKGEPEIVVVADLPENERGWYARATPAPKHAAFCRFGAKKTRFNAAFLVLIERLCGPVTLRCSRDRTLVGCYQGAVCVAMMAPLRPQ